MAQPSPAFAAISPDDHRGDLWIASVLSFVFTTLTMGARLYVRRHMLGSDDYATVAAVLLAAAQYICLFVGMPLGLGTSKQQFVQQNNSTTGAIFLASEALFVCGMYAAKLAVLLATERLLALSMRVVRRACIVIRAALGAAAIASVVTITVGCSPTGLLSTADQRHCDGQVRRWTVLSVVDGVTELCILSVFYGIIWSLHMSRKVKVTLTVLVGFRVVCPVMTGIRTSAISSYTTSSDPAVAVISPLVWQQVALGYSLMSALLVALMPFIKSFHTGMAMNVVSLTRSGNLTGSNGRSHGDAGYRLRDLSGSGPAGSQDAIVPNRAAGQGGIQRTVDFSLRYGRDERA